MPAGGQTTASRRRIVSGRVQTHVHGAPSAKQRRAIARAVIPSSAGQAARQAKVIRSAQRRPVQRHVHGAPSPHQQRNLERAVPAAAQGRVNPHLARHRINRERQQQFVRSAAAAARGTALGGQAATARGQAKVIRAAGPVSAAGLNIPSSVPIINIPGKVLGGIAEAANPFTGGNPLDVGYKTLKGGGQEIAGLVTAVPQLAINAVNKGPLQAAEDFGKSAVDDVVRRYGPLLAEGGKGRQQFVKRIRKEGAAPELTDIATAAIPAGAVAGRALTPLARAGLLGARLERVAKDARPALRVTAGDKAAPGVVREQEVSRNLFRAIGQRGEDALRERKTARQRKHATERDNRGIAGLIPQDGEVVMRSGRAQARAQKIEASKVPATALHAERLIGHAVDQEVGSALKPLSPLQREALAGPIGHKIVDPRDRERALAQIETRKSQIAAERGRLAEAGASRAEVRGLHKGSRDELRLLDRMKKNIGEVAGGQQGRKIVDAWTRVREVQRGHEELNPGLHPLGADVRRLAPVAEHLGVPNLVEESRRVHNEGVDAMLAQARADGQEIPHDLEQAMRKVEDQKWRQHSLPEAQGTYLDAIHAAVHNDEHGHGALELPGAHPPVVENGDLGLPEALFIKHEERPGSGRMERTLGGSKANRGYHKSELDLFRAGTYNFHPSIITNSILQGVKKRFNWNVVSDQFERHAYRPPRDVLDAAGLRGRDPNALTPHELLKVKDHLMLSDSEWQMWQPGRFRRAAKDGGAGTGDVDMGDAAVAKALDDSSLSVPEARKGVTSNDPTVKSKGWYLVHRVPHEEIMATAHPSGLAGRGLGKAMGLTSYAILGLSPTWEAFQVAANTFTYAASGRNPLDVLSASRAFRKLPKKQQLMLRSQMGSGMGRGHARVEHIAAASTGHPAVRAVQESWDELRSRPDVQFLMRQGRKVNPAELNFAVDDFNNRTFRQAALYSAAKRDLMAKSVKDAGGLMRTFDQVFGVGRHVGARPSRKEVLRHLEDKPTVERLMTQVNDLLGDYTRYTARERRVLKRGVIFYGFFRYATKALFRTLPKRHPVALALALKLAQVHNRSIDELLGMTPGDPEAPWAYSRLFFGPDKSIDLARMSPVETPITQLGTEDVRALGGFAPPYAQWATNQLYGTPLIRPFGYRVGGNAEGNQTPNITQRARIALNDILSLAAPYRIAKDATQTGTQGDESLLGFPAPIKYKTPGSQALERSRRKKEPDTLGTIEQQLIPLIPRYDKTRTQAVPAAKRKRGTGKPKGGSSGGGYRGVVQGAGRSGSGEDYRSVVKGFR